MSGTFCEAESGADWRDIARQLYTALEAVLDNEHLEDGLQVSDSDIDEAVIACNAYCKANEP